MCSFLAEDEDRVNKSTATEELLRTLFTYFKFLKCYHKINSFLFFLFFLFVPYYSLSLLWILKKTQSCAVNVSQNEIHLSNVLRAFEESERPERKGEQCSYL